jgi:hypothetical protein
MKIWPNFEDEKLSEKFRPKWSFAKLIPDDSENGRSLDNLLDKTSRDRVVISLLSELEQTVVKSQSVCEKFEQNVAQPIFGQSLFVHNFHGGKK